MTPHSNNMGPHAMPMSPANQNMIFNKTPRLNQNPLHQVSPSSMNFFTGFQNKMSNTVQNNSKFSSHSHQMNNKMRQYESVLNTQSVHSVNGTSSEAQNHKQKILELENALAEIRQENKRIQEESVRKQEEIHQSYSKSTVVSPNTKDMLNMLIKELSSQTKNTVQNSDYQISTEDSWTASQNQLNDESRIKTIQTESQSGFSPVHEDGELEDRNFNQDSSYAKQHQKQFRFKNLPQKPQSNKAPSWNSSSQIKKNADYDQESSVLSRKSKTNQKSLYKHLSHQSNQCRLKIL